MTPRMQAILDRIYQYNARHLAQHTFGLSEETVYDALLVVSDNLATGAPLVGRSEALQQRYEHTRRVVLMELIGKIAGA